MLIKCLLPAALAGSLVCAQPVLPDTPAARRFGDYIDILNRRDETALRAFCEKYSPERLQRIAQILEFRDMTGGFEILKVEKSSPTGLTAFVKERDSDQFARAEIEVEAAEPHRIVKLGMRTIPHPAEIPGPEPFAGDDLDRALGPWVASRAADGKFSGSVLVARNGKILFHRAYGLENKEHKIPNTIDTKFRLGSMNKMFTAVAVAQLAQAGKLRFDDPIGKHIKDYPNQDVATNVTIHHLLSHTGGTGDIFGPEFDKNRHSLRTLADYVALYGKRGLEFEPGAKWEYSNYGFLLAGVIVDRVSGQSYYDYVRQHIFRAAGMNDTDSYPEDAKVAKRSVGYTREGGGGLKPNSDTLPYRGTSAGGGYSTVGDLYRFARALLGHKLLSADYTKTVTSAKVDTPGGKYGYGFGIGGEGGVSEFGHGGGAPGMNGDLRIFPESGYIVAVLANLDPPAATRVSQYIGLRLPGLRSEKAQSSGQE